MHMLFLVNYVVVLFMLLSISTNMESVTSSQQIATEIVC